MIGYGLIIPIEEGLESIVNYKETPIKELLKLTFTKPREDWQEREFDESPLHFWKTYSYVDITKIILKSVDLITSSDREHLFIGYTTKIDEYNAFKVSKVFYKETKDKIAKRLRKLGFYQDPDFYVTKNDEFNFEDIR